MLRAIFFLDCDYCHEAYPQSYTRTVGEGDIGTPGWLECDAFEDGWVHCLDENSGNYLLMCPGCHSEIGNPIATDPGWRSDIPF